MTMPWLGQGCITPPLCTCHFDVGNVVGVCDEAGTHQSDAPEHWLRLRGGGPGCPKFCIEFGIALRPCDCLRLPLLPQEKETDMIEKIQSHAGVVEAHYGPHVTHLLAKYDTALCWGRIGLRWMGPCRGCAGLCGSHARGCSAGAAQWSVLDGTVVGHWSGLCRG